MQNMTLQDVGILVALVLTLLGWAYQLGFSGARLSRSEKDILELKSNEKEYRSELGKNLDRIYDKLDALPCRTADKDRC